MTEVIYPKDWSEADILAAELGEEVARLRKLITKVWKVANECSEEPIDMDETLLAICILLSKEENK